MLRSLAWCLCLAALCLAACSDPEETPSPPAEPVWETAFDTTGAGSISGVWGSSPNDVFAVGGDETRGVVFHFDGTTWSPMTIPQVPLLVWVFGFGPDDVYAVGVGGGAIHFDGTQWSALDTGTDTDLWGVFGLSPAEVWIVGGDVFDGAPLILRYDGTDFTQVTVDPAQNPVDAHALFKVFGIGTKLFAVGQRGLILERVGDQWINSPAGPEANDDFVSLWGTSEDNIIAVGGRANARIALYDGQTWRTIAPSAVGGLNAVFMEASGETLIGGVFGFGGLFDTDAEEITSEDTTAALDIHAIWGDGAGRFYAVGGNFRPPFQGVALVRRTVP